MCSLTIMLVVDEASRLKITLTDGRIFTGKVVGTDKTTDLAVIKLDSTETLPFAALGNSDDLKIGQIVIAIGNPFGLIEGQTERLEMETWLKKKIKLKKGY